MLRLSNEIILMVAEATPPLSHLRLSATCRTFRALLKQKAMLRIIYFRFHFQEYHSSKPPPDLWVEGRTQYVESYSWHWDELGWTDPSANEETLLAACIRKSDIFGLMKLSTISMALYLPYFFPNVRSIEYNFGKYTDHNPRPQGLWTPMLWPNLHNIRHMYLSEFRVFESEFRMLIGLKSLESLCLGNVIWANPVLGRTIIKSEVKLLQFYMSSMHATQWPDWYDILACFDGLETFSFDCDGAYAAPNMVCELSKLHHHSLRRLHLPTHERRSLTKHFMDFVNLTHLSCVLWNTVSRMVRPRDEASTWMYFEFREFFPPSLEVLYFRRGKGDGWIGAAFQRYMDSTSLRVCFEQGHVLAGLDYKNKVWEGGLADIWPRRPFMDLGTDGLEFKFR